MSNILSNLVIGIGTFFVLFGTIGLVRLPDLYNRLQAATKCATLGICSILLGIIISQGISALSMKSLLCIIFLMITSPAAAHALAHAAHISGVKLWEKSVCDKYAEDKSKEEGQKK